MQETLAARAQGRSGGRVDHDDRRLPSQSARAAGRDAAAADAGRARRGGAEHPVYLSEGFNGPSVTNSAGKKFFESQTPPIPVGADGSIAASAMATGRATLLLRQTLLDAEQRQRGAVDAMKYGLSLGVTTHLDQGAFQASEHAEPTARRTRTTTRCTSRSSRCTREGQLPARLRINFLHQDATPELATLNERLRNAFPFFGDDMVRTGGIGEFIAGGFGPSSPMVAAAQADREGRLARRGRTRCRRWTSSRRSRRTRPRTRRSPITDLRWVVAHVPFITEPWVNRLKAMGGGLSLTSWRYLAGTPQQNGPPIQDDRRQRHPLPA